MTTTVAVMSGERPADTTALANLAQHAADAQGAYASNTERALRSDVAVFTAWCEGAGLASLPALAGTVAAFVSAMAATKAPATVRRYLSSVATFHRAAKLPNPCEAELVRLALRRLHREKGRAQVQAAPLNRGLVDSMIAKAGVGTKSLRDRALLALAYDTLCRRSELVALYVASLERGSAGDGTVLISRGKTDQEGRGMVRYVAPDTMRHLRAWLDAAQIEDGPLFRSVSETGRIGGPLDPGDVSRIFKALATKAVTGAKPRVKTNRLPIYITKRTDKPCRFKAVDLPTHSDLCSAAFACPGFCSSCRRPAWVRKAWPGYQATAAASVPPRT